MSEERVNKELEENAKERGNQSANKPNEERGEPAAGLLQRRLGEVVAMMAMSDRHCYMFISDLRWSVLPPLGLGQYQLARDNQGGLVAYVSWAWVDEEREKRLSGGVAKLRPDEWKCGERAVIMDMLIPRGGAKVRDAMLSELREKVFRGEVLKAFRWDVSRGRAVLGDVV